jgi:glutathione S-transferase
MAQRKAFIIGNPISPYVRKVLAACAIKDVTVEIDPIVPFLGDEKFSAVSPLRRVPVYRDDLVTLCDSSVICNYLEDRWPTPRLYPEDIALRAKARWLEEFGDTRVGDIFVFKVFTTAVIAPAIFGTERDKAKLEKAINEDVPEVMNYLESQMPESGFLCGSLSIADLAIAPYFSNLQWARVVPDAARWPKTMRWLSRVQAESPLGKLNEIAAPLLRKQPTEHRDALRELGIAVSAETVGGGKPRLGPLTPAIL